MLALIIFAKYQSSIILQVDMGNFNLVCGVFNKNGNHCILLVSSNSKKFRVTYMILIQRMRTITLKHCLMSNSGFLNRSPRLALGATERFSGGQKQWPTK